MDLHEDERIYRRPLGRGVEKSVSQSVNTSRLTGVLPAKEERVK